MAHGMTDAPQLTVTTRESPLYRALGVGFTDRIALLGHADGLDLNTPFPVASMQEAITAMEADGDSPLLRALIESYYAGARDMWVVAVAPMSEYEFDLAARDTAYYQQYSDRLATAYELLGQWGVPRFTVPVDAPLNSTVDFLTPLADFCENSFNLSGEISLGFIGTRGILTDAEILSLSQDPRLDQGFAGKFVAAFVGDVTTNLKELPFNNTGSAATISAATLSAMPLARSVMYQRLPNVITIAGPDLTQEQVDILTHARLNPVIRTILGKRGVPFETVVATDNTLAPEGSDYWSLLQMRIAAQITEHIRDVGQRTMGVVGLSMFKNRVERYLEGLADVGEIRDYDLDITRDELDPYKVLVNLNLHLYFGLRDIFVAIEIGPNER